jgi:hypothetical protein
VEMTGGSVTGLTFWTDFDGDGAQDLNAADPEVLTYRWAPATRTLTLTANDATGTAVTRPVLAAQVSRFEVDLQSSKWQYDTPVNGLSDGVTTWRELDAAGLPIGDGDSRPDGQELALLDLVQISMTVLDGARAQTYTTRVDLRNRN